MIDPGRRLYRDGGCLGIDVTLRMVQGALPLLAPGGRLVFYTGSPVIAGEDRLKAALIPLLTQAGLQCRYEELDVDIFGSDLKASAYGQIERIAVVAIVAVGLQVLLGLDGEPKQVFGMDLVAVR